jgi:diamine N-acetyltransferase
MTIPEQLKKRSFRLEGKRLTLRSLRRNDIYERLAWREYRDPLYGHYNLPEMTASQKKQWYLKRINDPERVHLTIESSRGKVIGFMSLGEIDGPGRAARFGIYFGADYVDKNYGTEAIGIFLRYYFESLGFRELCLDVASLNLRAISCYRKCHFQFVRTFYRRHDPRSEIDIFGDPRFEKIRKYFKKEKKGILVQFQEMRITRRAWMSATGRRPAPNRKQGFD